jgi:hypothetical protein
MDPFEVRAVSIPPSPPGYSFSLGFATELLLILGLNDFTNRGPWPWGLLCTADTRLDLGFDFVGLLLLRLDSHKKRKGL